MGMLHKYALVFISCDLDSKEASTFHLLYHGFTDEYKGRISNTL